MSKTCPNCGSPVQNKDTVCSNCGANLAVDARQGDATLPAAGTAGQVEGYTHRLSESEKNMTFGRVDMEGSAKGQTKQKDRRSPIGLFVPVLLVALAVALVAILQMSKKLTELESTAGETQVQALSKDADDSSAAEEPPAEDSDVDAQVDSEAQEDDGESTDAEASKDEGLSESNKKKKYHGLIGTWTGILQPTDRSVYCYGASDMPMIIEIKDVADTGMITADMKVCFHGHGSLENSAASTEGDAYLEFKGLALTCSNGRIIYDNDKLNEYAGISCSLYVQLDVTDIDSDNPQMTGLVLGAYDLGSYEKNGIGHSEDRYVFEKS